MTSFLHAQGSPFRTTSSARAVIWEPVEKAVVEHEDIFRKHFMTQEVVLGSKKFAALHQAWGGNLARSLYVPPNVEIDLPIEIFHWLHGLGRFHRSRTPLLVAGENSKVTLVDYFESSDDQAPGLAIGVNDLILGAGAKLTYICAQNWSDKTLAFQINSTVVGRDASAVSMNVNPARDAAHREREQSRRAGGAQRHAGGFRGRWRAGIRPPHLAGPPAAEYRE